MSKKESLQGSYFIIHLPFLDVFVGRIEWRGNEGKDPKQLLANLVRQLAGTSILTLSTFFVIGGTHGRLFDWCIGMASPPTDQLQIRPIEVPRTLRIK